MNTTFKNPPLSFTLKTLLTERILQEHGVLILNHSLLLKLSYQIANYKPFQLGENHINKVYNTCKDYLFLRYCTACETSHLPNNTYCSNCGDLLNNETKYNINLGE